MEKGERVVYHGRCDVGGHQATGKALRFINLKTMVEGIMTSARPYSVNAPPSAASVVSLNAGRRPVRGPLWTALVKITLDRMQGSLNTLFEKLDDSLYDMSNASSSNASHAFFEGLRALRKQRAQVVSVILGHVGEAWTRCEQGQSLESMNAGGKANRSEMALIDNDVLEEGLAIEVAARNAGAVGKRELEALRHRLAVLRGGVDAETVEVPVAPEHLLEAFQAGLNEIPALTTEVKIVIYKNFDRQVLHHTVPEIYKALNDAMVEAGILRDWRPPAPTIRREESPADRAGAPAEGQDEAPPSSSDAASGRERSGSPSSGTAPTAATSSAPGGFLSMMGNLLAGFRRKRPAATPDVPMGETRYEGPGSQAGSAPSGSYPSGYASSPAGPAYEGPPVDLDELVSGLQWLQSAPGLQAALGSQGPSTGASSPAASAKSLHGFQDIPAPGPNVDPMETAARLKSQILSILNSEKEEGQAPAHISQPHEDIIDTVALLFDFVGKDDVLPPALQAILSRLQIPYLRMALMEPELFVRPNHPARLLLNLMSEAAKGCSTEPDETAAQIVGVIEQSVNTIITSPSLDRAVFERQMGAFREDLTVARRRADVRERRLADTVKGQETMRAARSAVAEGVVPLVRTGLPDWFSLLLLRSWTTGLTLIWNKEGPDSKEFIQGKSWMNDMTLLARATPSPNLRRAVDERWRGWCVTWNMVLTRAALSPEDIEKWTRELKGWLSERAGASLPPVAPAVTQARVEQARQLPEAPPLQLTPPSPPPPPSPDPVSSEALETAERVTVGTWIEFSDTDTVQRGKLLWISPFSRRLLFVGTNGLQVRDWGREQLAAAFSAGHARRIPEEALMERAMGSIVRRLKADADADAQPA